MCSSHTHGDLKSLPRCGGPRKTTPIVDEQIVQASLADLAFFQFSKNHNSVNFCRRQKCQLKYRYEISFYILKNFKNGGTNLIGGIGVSKSYSTILPVIARDESIPYFLANIYF